MPKLFVALLIIYSKPKVWKHFLKIVIFFIIYSNIHNNVFLTLIIYISNNDYLLDLKNYC